MADTDPIVLFEEGDEETQALQIQFELAEAQPALALRSKRLRIEPPPPFDEDKFIADMKADHSKLAGNTNYNVNWMMDRLCSARLSHKTLVEQWKISSARAQHEDDIRLAAAAEAAEKKRVANWVELTGDNTDMDISYPVGNAYPMYYAAQSEKTKEARIDEWSKATRNILEAVCPSLLNPYNGCDSKVNHHGGSAKVLLVFGKYAVGNIIDTNCSRAAKAEGEFWYENFVATVMAIIKGDNSGNCTNVYRAYCSVTKAPKYVSGSPAEFYASYRNYLNSVFAMALYQHKRDCFSAKAAAATAHAKVTNQGPHSITKGSSDAAKAIAGPTKKE